MNSPDDCEEALEALSPEARAAVRRDEPMRRHTTLRVGGPADWFLAAADTQMLAEAAAVAQRRGLPHFVLGEGSNICVSDAGLRGLVIYNACRRLELGPTTYVDAGYNFMRLFVKTLGAGLSGLEFAVGIPGTVGGALVSNAGAYRANICDLVVSMDVVEDGVCKRVGPEWMEFSYRDSRLRHPERPPSALLGVTLALTPGDRTSIRRKAGDFQHQRILKQPWQASAGSFFKNVYDRDLAQTLPTLPASMKTAGVVPAAYLSEACGCKGLRIGDAGISPKHANFLVNYGRARATDVRAVAETVRARVRERFDVRLEEEALYVGDWT